MGKEKNLLKPVLKYPGAKWVQARVMVSTLCVLYLHSVVAVRPDLRGVYDIAWVLAVLTTVLALVLLFRR